jgi:two-component system CheB/CheR fusion protein
MSDNERTVPDFPPSSPGVTPSRLPFFVVGLGASAGGIEALQRFFEQMPAENGMAFVVVLHLSPVHESSIAQILQTKTKMPVSQVSETVAIEKNHVYVIPPAKDLLMNDGVLQVVSAARPRGGHAGIDVFMRTLAEVHRERAVGVILSGTGSDGAVGLARIKERGGLAVAQAPDDAEYDGMPRAAIDSGTVDVVLPVVEIPQKLMEWSRNAAAIKLPALAQTDEAHQADNQAKAAPTEEMALSQVMAMLRERTGNDFSHYKRASLLRRLERRLQVTALPNIVAYRDYLAEHTEETKHLLQDLLISVTNFFRDRDAFEALEREIIPKIFANAGDTEQIRAWSAGCATGEEAYSLAMLLADQNVLEGGQRTVQVFGTDIDEAAIRVARRGVYPDSIITDVPPGRLRQYFDQEDKHLCVKKSIREKVLFASHNLLRDPPFSKLHLVSCRNLLIYLNRDRQAALFEMLHYALLPGGYLFLGSAESADSVPKLFIPINKKHRIYQAAYVKPSFYHSPPQAIALNGEPTRQVADPKQASGPPVRGTEEVHEAFVKEYSPPSVLIDLRGDLLYATKHAGRFLHHPAGEASMNIMAIIRPELQPELRTALFQATHSHQPLETRPILLHIDDKETVVRIVITPGQDQYAATGMTLLTFEEVRGRSGVITELPPSEPHPLGTQFQQELQQAKEQLKAVSEQYETALQDLKTSNEEFQSANEELRSTAEELEASKEELQSINEELLTSNLEWKRRIDDMAKDSDDLQNFLAATDIAMIFVDANIGILRFTAPCSRLFNLIPADVGRSLLDITHRLDYPMLRQDIEQVLKTAELVEREVPSSDGRWHIARLLPYRTAEGRVDGAVLTVIDISRRKAAEDRARVGEQRLRLIAASTKDYAIWTLDTDGIVTSWNQGAVHLLGYTEEEMVGQSAEMLVVPEERVKNGFRDALRRAEEDGRIESEKWFLSKDGSRVRCSAVLSSMHDADVRGYANIARFLT